MLAIIQNTGSLNKQAYAFRILVFLIRIYIREVADLKEQKKDVKTWATTSYAEQRLLAHQKRIEELEGKVTNLVAHKETLCDFLVYSANTTPQILNNWKWSMDDEVPEPCEYAPSVTTAISESLFVPTVCPNVHCLQLWVY